MCLWLLEFWFCGCLSSFEFVAFGIVFLFLMMVNGFWSFGFGFVDVYQVCYRFGLMVVLGLLQVWFDGGLMVF